MNLDPKTARQKRINERKKNRIEAVYIFFGEAEGGN